MGAPDPSAYQTSGQRPFGPLPTPPRDIGSLSGLWSPATAHTGYAGQTGMPNPMLFGLDQYLNTPSIQFGGNASGLPGLLAALGGLPPPGDWGPVDTGGGGDEGGGDGEGGGDNGDAGGPNRPDQRGGGREGGGGPGPGEFGDNGQGAMSTDRDPATQGPVDRDRSSRDPGSDDPGQHDSEHGSGSQHDTSGHDSEHGSGDQHGGGDKDKGGDNGGDQGGAPGMAHGGLVTRRTRATIGEQGPEAVVPLRPGRSPASSIQELLRNERRTRGANNSRRGGLPFGGR